jgi:hypothetical protein
MFYLLAQLYFLRNCDRHLAAPLLAVTRGRNTILLLFVALSAALSGCGVFGLTKSQRASAIEFGSSLSIYGQLLTEETSYVRSEVEQMHILAMSLPGKRSAKLFDNSAGFSFADGLDERQLERLTRIGGATERFGTALAKVADLNSSTTDEKIFSTVANNFVQVAGSVAEAFSEVSIGAPAVNLVTFVLTDAYRRKIIARTLEDVEPAVTKESTWLGRVFSDKRPDSLLFIYSQETVQLSDLLESGRAHFESASLTLPERELIATAYRVVARNLSHIHYVTSRQEELASQGVTAYEALVSAFRGDESRLSEVNRFSQSVFETNLAFKSLK